MPSLARYIRGIRAVGLKEWWHQLQYIGDVKVGTLVGSDQCVPRFWTFRIVNIGRSQVRKPLFRESQRRTGSARYVFCAVLLPSPTRFHGTKFLGRHRWVDFAQVGPRMRSRSMAVTGRANFPPVARFQCLASAC
jgi:hypothetical protein